MSKSKRKTFLYGLSAILAIIILGMLSTGNFGFTVVNEDVRLASFTRAECSPRADSMEEFYLGKTDGEEFYACTSENAGNKYIPLTQGVQCEFDVKQGGLTFHEVAECDKEDKDTCTELSGTFSPTDNVQTYRVDAGKYLFVNPQALSSTEVYGRFPSFGLRVIDDRNFGFDQTLNCDISSLYGTDFHTVGAENLKIVQVGRPVNVVTGTSVATSTRLVRLDDVAGGDLIYIAEIGAYWQVKTADDGFKYVDTTQPKQFDEDIECLPRFQGCSDDAKIIPLEEQTVDRFGGAVGSNYAPVEGDPTKLCRYEVSNGKLRVTNDCVASNEACPADKPIFDYRNGECVSQQPPHETTDEIDYLFILSVGMVLLFLIVVVLIIRMERGRR